MSWRDALMPVSLSRVAVVAPTASLRDALVELAAIGRVELDESWDAAGASVGEAARRLQPGGAAPAAAAVRRRRPDLDALERAGRRDLLAGEAQVDRHLQAAVRRGSVAAVVGWAPEEDVAAVAARLAPCDAVVVPLPRPRGIDPPTLLREGRADRAFGPLVRTYATVPSEDLDPTVFAGLAYVVMFSLMFGDVGHGVLLLVLGLLLRSGRPRALASAQRSWLFVALAGLASALVGLAYGEAFGPTGLVRWQLIDPLDEPVRLMVVGVAVGVVLLAVAYALGTVNRVREGGWGAALLAPTGIAGTALFLGSGAATLGLLAGSRATTTTGFALAGSGLLLVFLGLLSAAGGGGAGVMQALVETADTVVRLGSNVASFARLAAFGLTHAALGQVVWNGTTALWDRGGIDLVLAVLVVVLGNALTFGLEAVVAGVQALRLEYYELFSRVFQGQGRPFQPWSLAVIEPDSEEITS